MDFFFFHSTNILTQTLSHYQNMKKIAKVQTMCHNYFCQKFHCIYFFFTHLQNERNYKM